MMEEAAAGGHRQEGQGLSVREMLYFGSVVASFAVAEGQTFAYCPGTSFQEGDPADEAQRQLSLNRLQPAAFLGPDHANLILPAVPAVDLVPTKAQHDVGHVIPTSLPELLRRPLVKSESSPVATGVQSGRRSALIKTQGKWYRLKGCGDQYAGFPVRRVADRNDECFEIRGCTFSHTASRELYMFDRINDLLLQHNMPVSNSPIGWFEYASTPGTPYPAVKRCCAIYETKGERRLGDHVLVGLELALPLLLQDRLDTKLLLEQFDERRKQKEGSTTSVTETWLCALTDCAMGDFIDVFCFHLDERAPRADYLNSQGIRIPQEFVSLWNESAAELDRESLKKKEAGIGSILAYLYWRFGREAGSIQRLLRKNDISWGTYVDPLGTHCNAHPNNFVLIPEGDFPHNFLAPMDFDMAFTRRTFNQSYAQYEEWMALEDRALKMALAGDEQLSTGMTGVAQLSADFSILKWALRDTMVRGFISGYEDTEDIHPPIPELAAAAHALIRLALMLTAHSIA